MTNYNPIEVAECLLGAKNLNAATKKLLKSDLIQDEDSSRCIKSLRKIAKSPREESIRSFAEKEAEKGTEALVLITQQAYTSDIEQLLEPVIDNYAEDFNQSYQGRPDGGIEVSDDSQFESIASKAIDELSKAIGASELPQNSFMKQAVFTSLFDRAVLAELQSRGLLKNS